MAVDPAPLLGTGVAADGWRTDSCAPLVRLSTLLRQRATRIVLVLLAVNGAALGALLMIGRTFPSLVSAGVLALSFGLRHAVDADHIAAIDNVTRRLITEGKQPLLVGLWFSLGHSSVVCLICVAAACGSAYLQAFFDGVAHGVGGIISVLVSAGLLLAVGIANLIGALQTLQREGKDEDDGHGHEHGGLVARCCPMVLRAVDAEWKMVLLGFLFGLGFETSSEIALLALAAMAGGDGIPPAATLILPLLFAGGMSLVDTLDGMVMSFAYRAAAQTPGGRQVYNLILTIASSAIAISVGVIELFGCVQSALDLHGPLWDAVEAVNANFEYVGYFVIGFFAVSMFAALTTFACPRAALTLSQDGEEPVLVEQP